MPTFVNHGKNVFRNPTDPELANLDARQIEAPETREIINGSPTDELSKEARTVVQKPRGYELMDPKVKSK